MRACAIEMRMDMSQEPFYTEIDKENAGAQIEHLDQTPALTPTSPAIRTPQCGHTALGQK